jgi:hypothetical protein
LRSREQQRKGIKLITTFIWIEFLFFAFSCRLVLEIF